MKFSEKLTKLRKEKGLSQEELADKLDVSRQSVSKWELGTTYPEMDKLLSMCKIFNVTLDDLTNDEVDFKEVKTKNRNYFDSMMDDFTYIIDNTYNMFKNSTSGDRTKMILELVIIFIVLLFCKIPFNFVCDEVSTLVLTIPHIGIFFRGIWTCFVNLAYLGLFIFTFLYIYKSQFLDKFVNKKENTKEEVKDNKKEETKEVNKEETKDEVKEERIVRDNKTSKTSGALFNTIKGIIVVCFKIFLVLMFIPSIFAFVGLFVAFFILLFLILNGALYFGFMLSIIGATILCGLFIKILFSGIADSKMNPLAVFITGITALAIFGMGIGLSSIEVSNTSYINTIPENELDIYTKEYNYTKDDNVVINRYAYDSLEFIEDNTKGNDITIKISYRNKLVDLVVNEYNEKGYKVLDINTKENYSNEVFKIVLNDLKHKELHNYTKLYEYKIEFIASSEVINEYNSKLDAFDELMYSSRRERLENEANERINELEEEIDDLKETIDDLKDENESLKDKINRYKEQVNDL